LVLLCCYLLYFFLPLLFSNLTSTTELYTLSLHDALPIYNASRICHSPSKSAMKRSVGVGASTCNYQDWLGTDVLVFWGSEYENIDRKSTRLNSSHVSISYAVFCLKKKRSSVYG